AFLCPVNMLIQNFDDHNRSNRTVARDFGQNVLTTCDKNAILFTVGDNDTYPLWYNQEVEEFRTDVRHVLLTFLPIEWYAHQIGEKHGDKGKVPLSFNGEDMLMGDNQYIPVLNKFDTAIDLKDAIAVIKSDDPVSKVRAGNGVMYDYLPGNKLRLKLNKSNFIQSCSYFNLSENQLPDAITFTIGKKGLNRDDLLLLDLLAQNDWERPLFFVYPHLLDNIGLGAYLHREGNIYRFMPWKNNLPAELERAQALHQYKLVTENYKWGNIPGAFLDYFNRSVVSSFRYRQMFAQLALQLSSCGEREKAIEILDMCNEVLPGDAVSYDVYAPKIAEAYYRLGDKEKGDQFTKKILDNFNQKMSFYSNTTAKNNKTGFDADIGRTMYVYREFIMMLNNQSNEVYKRYSPDFKRYFDTFYGKG
ncbi:MAG: hypothetical protein MI922_20870, partial [Bacteroidales bacterium]|nr:hypothetical protein [Bacteroidales bacterium]